MDTLGGPQDIIFLSSHGIYRLLYSSKKKIAEEFREWVGDILDDLIFNQGKELKIQLEKYHLELEKQKQLLIEQTQVSSKEKEQIWKSSFRNKYIVYLLIISENLIKFGFTKDFDNRLSAHKTDYGKDIKIAFIIESRNNEMLETLFKNHEKIKFNIISQVFNEENKTELIKLDKNLNLKNVINILTDMNKVIDTIIETDVLKKYNVNLLNYQVQENQPQQPQQPQVIQLNENLQVIQPNEEFLSEELQFYKWLNNNVINNIGSILVWKDVMFKLMNRRIGSGVSSKFKKYFENWCKIKNPNITCLVYKLHRNGDNCVHGYTNFKLNV